MKQSARAPSEAPPESPLPESEPPTPDVVHGKFEYQSGAKYVGEYVIHEGVKKRHGMGKYTHPDSYTTSSIHASFHKPEPSQAVSGTTTPKMSMVSGSMPGSQPLQEEEETTENITEEYDGEWCKDQIHGYGVYKYKNGDVYDGYWDTGLYSGQGTYTCASGAKYSGEWANNRMHGQ